jgi:ABC-2 type transport system ATP-binding protein
MESPASVRAFYGRVGYMAQQWKYFGSFTALESVEYAAWLKGTPSRLLRAEALSALEWVQLSDAAATKVRRLSGGMQQRVGLAEAFVNDPRIVLLDEPTVGLDPAQRVAFRRFLRDKSADRAIILSTHLTDDVEATANRVIVMTNHGIAFDGSPAGLAARARDLPDGASRMEAGYLAVVGEFDESED